MRIRALARPAARRKIGHLPEHLPRIERVIEPASTLCGCGEMVRIGEDLRRTAELHAIEADIRGSPPERRLAERHARAAPLVETFGDWLKEQRARVSPKARLGELHSAHPIFRVSSTSPTSANAAAESNTSWRSRMACLRIAGG